MGRKSLTEEEKKAMADAKTAKKNQEREELKASLREELLGELREELIPNKEQESVVVGENEANSMIPSTHIPKKDLLDDPVHYYAWSMGLILFGYNHRGKDVTTPYGRPIVFKSMPPQITFDANNKRNELQWCSVEVWSKKQVEFIESHQLYKAGLIMHSADDLKYNDRRSANAKLKAYTEVSRLNDSQVIQWCRGRNLATSNDFESMRRSLTESLVKESTVTQRWQMEQAKRDNEALLPKR